VVDDGEQNRLLLRDLLEAGGYRVSEAENGEQALRLVGEDPADVIVMDVLMPIMDGFEASRRLKADPGTAPIPILMVTALTDRQDRLAGIRAGANDFLQKPIDTQDVLLRVRNAVTAKRLFDEVRQNYERLRQLEQLRDNLIHMIVHDMRSPLMGIGGYLQAVRREAEEKLSDLERECLQRAYEQAQTLIGMVSDLIDVSRLESAQMPLHVDLARLADVAGEAVGRLGFLAQMVRVSIEDASRGTPVPCDAEVIRRVIANLLGNALKFTRDGGEVRVGIALDGDRVRVQVADEGPGIPLEYQATIFDKFGQVPAESSPWYSSGLGLAFCKLAVEAHGGEIGVESESGRGSAFWFTLPAAGREEGGS
jgi:two-component system sensor histidine kinase/response regulator